MTLSLASNHDQHYSCPCGQIMHGNLPLASMATWTCQNCQQRLIIFMDDFSGNSYRVTRQLAKDVPIRETLVYRNGQTLTEGQVTQSHQYGAKPSNWYLVVKGYRGTRIAANSYVNIEHNPIVKVVYPTTP